MSATLQWIKAVLHGVDKMREQVKGEDLAAVGMTGQLQVKQAYVFRSDNRSVFEQDSK
jgi:hypothetical protein